MNLMYRLLTALLLCLMSITLSSCGHTNTATPSLNTTQTEESAPEIRQTIISIEQVAIDSLDITEVATSEDLDSITSLIIEGYNYSFENETVTLSLSGIETLKNLTHLTIQHASLLQTDLLSTAVSLNSLTLSYCEIPADTQLNGISFLNKLTTLYLDSLTTNDGTPVNLDILSAVQNLNEVTISTPLVQALPNLPQLETLVMNIYFGATLVLNDITTNTPGLKSLTITNYSSNLSNFNIATLPSLESISITNIPQFDPRRTLTTSPINRFEMIMYDEKENKSLPFRTIENRTLLIPLGSNVTIITEEEAPLENGERWHHVSKKKYNYSSATDLWTLQESPFDEFILEENFE
jgi:hypothetical protein